MAPLSQPGRKSEECVRFLGQPWREDAIVRQGSKQHGVLSLAQLVELGLTPRAAQLRVAAKRLHRVHRGVYSLVPVSLLTRQGHWMAAVLACSPGAVLSHRTAAALHGLRPTNRAKIDVTIPCRSGRNRSRIDVHRSTTLTPADVTIANGIPCTTVARTLLDLAAVVARRPVERAFDQADAEDALNLLEIDDQLARNPTHAGGRTVKAILEEHYIGSSPTESELEEAMYALCRRTGLRLPEVNKWIDLHDGESMIKADFLWRRERVIVETDGSKFHGTHQRRERDPRRDQRAILAGWRPVRTTWRQVMHRPQELESMLPVLLAKPAPALPQR